MHTAAMYMSINILPFCWENLQKHQEKPERNCDSCTYFFSSFFFPSLTLILLTPSDFLYTLFESSNISPDFIEGNTQLLLLVHFDVYYNNIEFNLLKVDLWRYIYIYSLFLFVSRHAFCNINVVTLKTVPLSYLLPTRLRCLDWICYKCFRGMKGICHSVFLL